jgi:hypothetical protein
MATVTVGALRYEWSGALGEFTKVTVWRGRSRVKTAPFELLVAQSGGEIVADFERAGVLP